MLAHASLALALPWHGRNGVARNAYAPVEAGNQAAL